MYVWTATGDILLGDSHSNNFRLLGCLAQQHEIQDGEQGSFANVSSLPW
jgi:hypothetical protein